MSSIFRIVGFAGCVREESSNKAALNVAQDLLLPGVELEILDIADLPPFEPITGQVVSASVDVFQEKIRQADAVVIMTPEYKGMLPHALTNALRWAGSSLAAKHVAVMGIGRQAGTASRQPQLRQILANYDAQVLELPEVYMTPDPEMFDHSGSLTDQASKQQMRHLLEMLVTSEKEAVMVG